MNKRPLLRYGLLTLGVFFTGWASPLTSFSALRAEANPGLCYVATGNTCATTCVSTGNWWQCLPIEPDGYAQGMCGSGSLWCALSFSPCDTVTGCGSAPPDYASCNDPGVYSCITQNHP